MNRGDGSVEAPLVDAWQRARGRRMRPLQIPGHKYRFADGADVPGAELFLVGGSSQGNIASLTAAGGPGLRVAVDRTSHRSALAGLVVSGSIPEWVYPVIHPEFGLPLGVAAESLAGLSGDVVALFVTSPTYVGTMTGVRELADRCHADDRTLIVDQAWGAHLGFMPGWGALEQGADIVTTSVHKALMGYSQTAVVAVRGARIDSVRLDRAVDLTGTTSPSATLLGVDGFELAARLWERGHGVEAADADSIVMTLSMLDEPEFCAEMTELLLVLIERLRGDARAPAPAALWQVVPDVVMSPREAFFAPRRRIRLADAVGEVSAEQFCPYPPGVPLLAPGERITAEVVRDIAFAGRIGRVAYCSDPTLESVEIVSG